MPDKIIGLDLDGVIRHNNKSLGAGDLSPEMRTRDMLMALDMDNALPACYYITQPSEVVFIDGALDSLKLFHALDIGQFVFTNQEAIGLAIMSDNDWLIVMDSMDKNIIEAGGEIDNWFWCPHFPDENCKCRKPKPGMLVDFSKHYGDYDLGNMVFIGDNPSDMEAAHRAGCGYKVHIVLENADPEFRHSDYSDIEASSLKDAVVPVLNWVFE